MLPFRIEQSVPMRADPDRSSPDENNCRRGLLLVGVAFVLAGACTSFGCSGTSSTVAARDAGGESPTAQGSRDAGDAPEGGDAAKPIPDTSGDITKSPECAAYCARVRACGAQCDPVSECAVSDSTCAEAHRAYLKCVADQGSFSCGPGGYSETDSCLEDTTVCPSVAADGGSCTLAAPDTTCVACARIPCGAELAKLQAEPVLPAFRTCLAACQRACYAPADCPLRCKSELAAAAEYMTLLSCAYRACPGTCTIASLLL